MGQDEDLESDSEDPWYQMSSTVDKLNRENRRLKNRVAELEELVRIPRELRRLSDIITIFGLLFAILLLLKS